MSLASHSRAKPSGLRWHLGRQDLIGGVQLHSASLDATVARMARKYVAREGPAEESRREKLKKDRVKEFGIKMLD